MVRATIRNEATTGSPWVPGGAGANFGGDLQKTYDFRFGPPGQSFGSDWVDQPLEPGGRRTFIFGVLTPLGGRAPEGSYASDPALMGIQSLDLPPVGGGFQIQVVPEPSVLGLLGLGAAACPPRRQSRHRAGTA